MSADQLLNKYYGKLSGEAWLRAALCGAIVAFGVLMATAITLWFLGSSLWWILPIVTVVALAGATVAFYYAMYRPSRKQIAARIDSYGLEERLLTMQELEGDTSYMAQMQREDTFQALADFDSGLISILVSIPVVIALSIVGAVSMGATTYYGLAEAGYAPTWEQVRGEIEEVTKPAAKTFTVTIRVESGEGYVNGKKELVFEVKEGEAVPDVWAVGAENWICKSYVNKDTGAIVTDEAGLSGYVVKGNTVLAISFEEAQDVGLSDPALNGSGSSGQKGNSSDKPQDGRPSEDDKNGDNDGDGGDGASGRDQVDDQHKVIDGQTGYGDKVYENAKNDAYETMEGENTSSDRTDGVENYFETIKK